MITVVVGRGATVVAATRERVAPPPVATVVDVDGVNTGLAAWFTATVVVVSVVEVARPTGVPLAAADAAPAPTDDTARTLIEYVVPFVNDVMRNGDVVPLIDTHVPLLSEY